MNARLITGLMLLIPVLAAVFFGPALAPYEKYYTESVRYEDTEQGPVLVVPPSAPSSEYLLGTTTAGKDILSLILYGARWTVGTTFVLALLRVLLGAISGVSAAFGKLRKDKTIKSIPLNALPQIVFLYFVLSIISINFPFNKMILISIFSVMVLIFGTPANSAAIEAVCREQKKREYYIAAEASGAGKWHLIINHIFPFMKERLLTLLISEIIAVLNTIGQMGIFGVFLGATVKTFSPAMLNSRLFDWAGLVGQARFYIYSEQWILFGPLAAYILYLVALYLILEGIKQSFRQSYRR